MAEPSPPLSPRHWPTWLLIGFGWALARAPLRVHRALGPPLGAVLYRLLGARRRAAATNLALCFPERSADEREALLRRNFRALGLGVFEFLNTSRPRAPAAAA